VFIRPRRAATYAAVRPESSHHTCFEINEGVMKLKPNRNRLTVILYQS